MENKDKKLKLDLDFLGEGASLKSEIEKKHRQKERQKQELKTPENNEPMSNTAKWTWGAIGVTVLVIVISVVSSGGSNTTTTTNTLPPPSNTKTLDEILGTQNTKTANQICKEEYGTYAYSTGNKKADGSPICDCNNGYQWNDSRTSCVAVPKIKTALEICQDRHGYNATYDGATNSCGCASGYSLGATSQQCVSLTVVRNESCAAKFPGTSWLKNDPTDGHPICDCVAGSYFNNERTACYSLSEFNKSCVNSYGTGAYSTTENGKRVCDCGYGYDWNIERNSCISTASINVMCERDVGRNSKYAGYVENGKYICTQPY